MKVAIVGAGVAGLGIGLRLRDAGVEVSVLERSQPARGATWAAAGMLSVLGENRDTNPALEALGRDAAKRWPEFARAAKILVAVAFEGTKRPQTLLIRLRHPGAMPMRSVTVDGQDWKDFDRAKEWVRIDNPSQAKNSVVAGY